MQGYGAAYELHPTCPCDGAKPCVHEQAAALAQQVEKTLEAAAAQDPWAEAILTAAMAFHTAHPEVDQGRIGRGIDLATQQAVAFRTDGSALVTNGGVKRPVTYSVTLGAEAQCHCEDVHTRHITWCKHSIAVQLTSMVRQATSPAVAHEEEMPDPEEPWTAVAEDAPLPSVGQDPQDLLTRMHPDRGQAGTPTAPPTARAPVLDPTCGEEVVAISSPYPTS